MGIIRWTEIHDLLQKALKEELKLMHALLENLGVEEQFILKKEKKYWKTLLEERSSLIQTLSQVKQDREEITYELEKLAKEEHPSLEKLLPPESLSSWEVLSLRDQIGILNDRLKLQAARNKMLTHIIATTPLASPQTANTKKKGVMTLDPVQGKSPEERG